MSQDYNVLQPTGIISQDRKKINNNFEAVASNFAGTAFPTSNLYAGMMCYRSDLQKLYYLNNDKTSWILAMDFSGGSATVANAVSATKAGELTSTLPVSNGGTGATTAQQARANLGIKDIATYDVLPITNGGTGATTVAGARNALGLGNTTGALPIANGGTGATTAQQARANLGLATVANTGSYNDLSNKPTIPSAYTLPTASSSILGGVKVGSGLSISNGVLSTSGGDSAYKIPYGICTTAENTAAKVATISNGASFSLVEGAVVALLFSHNIDGSSTNSVTLNVNSTGAKNVSPSAPSSGTVWKDKWGYDTRIRGLILFIYDGTYWRIADATTRYSN